MFQQLHMQKFEGDSIFLMQLLQNLDNPSFQEIGRKEVDTHRQALTVEILVNPPKFLLFEGNPQDRVRGMQVQQGRDESAHTLLKTSSSLPIQSLEPCQQ